MPGFRTHYVFGIETRNKLRKDDHTRNHELWYMLREYPSVYALGQQGPDIFFYNPSSYLHRRNTGERMHHERTLAFIENLIRICGTIRNKDLRNIAEVYTAGFIGHYTLDTTAHPYIHYRACKDIEDHSNKGFYNHMFLETDIDNAIIAHFLRRRPSEFHPSATIRISYEEAFFLSSFIQRALILTYPPIVLQPEITSAFRFTRYVYDLMEDPGRWKKKLLRSIEEKTLKHPQFSAMIANDDQRTYTDPCNLRHLTWHNPWNTGISSNESFYELFDKAEKKYIVRLVTLYRLFASETGSRDYYEYFRQLGSDLGNCSYDSGLELEQ